MSAGAIVATVAAGWLLISVPIAVVVAKAIDPTDSTEVRDDFLADIPVDCLGQAELDYEFFALTDPIEAEIDGRWAS